MLKKINKIILFIIGISFLIVFAFSSFLILKAYKQLPDVSKLVEQYNPVVPTIIYDTNGLIIDKIYRENREIVSINKIPKYTQYAFVAIEDRKFFRHHGFDLFRLLKSVVTAPKYILAHRNIPGGSTITQQLAKNAFLTTERKIIRKVKEAIITIEIERKYTKDEILEKYLNEIPFASGAYGIETASKLYFRKDVEQLNIAESAFLAGIPNRPSKYSPYLHLNNTIKRQRLILKQMFKFKFINKKQYEEALNYKIKVSPKPKKNYRAPSFTDIVTKKIFKLFPENEIYGGGLKIYTTLNLKMQQTAEEVFKNNRYLKKYKDLNGALVTIDSNTGYVEAIIGGKNYITGNFNRAIRGKRQPGSSFKPFLYFTALRKNYQMNLIVEDSKIKIGNWEPKNYSSKFRKNMTILQGMEKSVNIIAIKLLKKLIIKNVIATARLAGITVDIPYNLTIALGSFSISPFQLANAYCVFSNGGFTVKPIFIKKVVNRYGKIVYESKIKKEKVFDKTNISLITHMLQNVVWNGSGRHANIGIDQGGKTGTTNNSTNAWFSGITADFVTTLYIGYDNNKPMPKYMTGGGVAAPIWGKYVKTLIDKKIYKPNKFEFLQQELKNKKIEYKIIDNQNGLLSDKSSTSKIKALFKMGYAPIEKAGKYKNGIEALLPKNEPVQKDKDENLKKEFEINNIINSFIN
ncbi:transglycosylase domain-containing protein [Haliovirga abyssi]|uniref:Penicillin-binding protein n=1 Tax=Haliovirga abyssi TaxID=2996794 RepID=A0AAU9DA36_9FUSO|nr:PBP1A family penicillin-binding protein [Haliovirga abyssi]BDU50451.1 penicillin-binding protein [Haliovirga abyssi]